MITRNFEITIRIPEQNYIPTLFQVVENDKDVYNLTIHITDGINEIDYSQVSSATITFALANGAVVQSDPERLTVSATGIIYQMGTSEIACPGKVMASIQLYGEDGERLTTARFQFEVVADLITPSVVKSTSEFPILQQLKQELEDIDVVELTNQFNAHKAEIATIQDAYLYENISADVSIANDVLTIVQFDEFSNGSNMDLSGDDGKSVILPAGTYLISAKVAFASNATGYRSLLLGAINNSLSLTWRLAYDIKNAVDGEYTTLEVNRILAITSEMKIGLFVKQNSGGALNIISSNQYTALIVRRIL